MCQTRHDLGLEIFLNISPSLPILRSFLGEYFSKVARLNI